MFNVQCPVSLSVRHITERAVFIQWIRNMIMLFHAYFFEKAPICSNHRLSLADSNTHIYEMLNTTINTREPSHKHINPKNWHKWPHSQFRSIYFLRIYYFCVLSVHILFYLQYNLPIDMNLKFDWAIHEDHKLYTHKIDRKQFNSKKTKITEWRETSGGKKKTLDLIFGSNISHRVHASLLLRFTSWLINNHFIKIYIKKEKKVAKTNRINSPE